MGQKTTKIKTRVKKDGTANSGGYVKCPTCNGTGVVKSKKKK